jgi:hypothetical protein
VSQGRHTFVVTVFEDGRVVVVEDVHTGVHARVEDLARVGAQIEAWLAEPAAPAAPGGAAPTARRTSPPTSEPARGRSG